MKREQWIIEIAYVKKDLSAVHMWMNCNWCCSNMRCNYDFHLICVNRQFFFVKLTFCCKGILALTINLKTMKSTNTTNDFQIIEK